MGLMMGAGLGVICKDVLPKAWRLARAGRIRAQGALAAHGFGKAASCVCERRAKFVALALPFRVGRAHERLRFVGGHGLTAVPGFEDFVLKRFHDLGFLFHDVVVAAEVQQAMHEQQADFLLERSAELVRL